MRGERPDDLLTPPDRRALKVIERAIEDIADDFGISEEKAMNALICALLGCADATDDVLVEEPLASIVKAFADPEDEELEEPGEKS